MKILIIRFSSIGDIVLTEPISYILHQKFPNATIDYLTKPAFIPIVKAFRKIDKIYTRTDKLLYKQKYDIIIDLHSKLSSFIAKHRVKSKKIITYNKKHFLRLLIVKKLTTKQISSTLDLYTKVLEKLNITHRFEKPRLKPIFAEKAHSLYETLPKDKKIIAVFPGARHNTKIYPYMSDFIKLEAKSLNVHFVLLGGKDDIDAAETIKSDLPNISDFTGKFNLAELIYFVFKTDVVISNDSGPMHIAAALDKPQIAIFGSTSTKLGFKPLNNKAIVLEKNLPCQPCTLHGREECPLGHFRCMKEITVEIVEKSLEKLL